MSPQQRGLLSGNAGAHHSRPRSNDVLTRQVITVRTRSSELRVLRQNRSGTGQFLTRGIVDRRFIGTRNGLGLTVITLAIAARYENRVFVFRVNAHFL
ncbi:hypothetical protein, partial [Salmonella enterica]|uniref:hypothetical protein n=1 Tax=Salmonella enterica TaxID=28901 RepID=UPI003966DC50